MSWVEDVLRWYAPWIPRIKLELSYHINAIQSQPFPNIKFYNPLRILWIDPVRLDCMMNVGQELSREHTPGVVLGGNWDHNTSPFAESIYFRSFQLRFNKNQSWDETPLYESAMNRNRDNRWKGCTNETEVMNKLSEYTEIYRAIRDHGYLTNRELQRRGMERTTLVPPEQREIRINIDRNGEPIFDDGRHRLAIAKVLDIDYIPVIIMGRHREWYEHGGVLSDLPYLIENEPTTKNDNQGNDRTV